MEKTIKKGIITYNKNAPNTITYKQLDMADKVSKEIIKLGYDVYVEYDGGTIDIIIAMDLDGNKYLNKGRFRIFWCRDGNNKLQYLGVGIGHYDGYEIKRGWSPNLEIKDVLNVLKKDIAYYNNRKNN